MKYKIFTLITLLAVAYKANYAQPVIADQKTIGGTSGDRLQAVYVTKDNGTIIGGYSYSGKSGEKTQKSRGGFDYWIIKLKSNHAIQWDKTIGGSGNDFLFDLQQTSDVGYILGGYSNSYISGEKTQNSRGYEDYWVVKLDSAGNVQWDKTIGGSNVDKLTALKQTKAGKYILGGSSSSPKSGEKTQNSKGGIDYWVVKLDSMGNVNWDKTIGGNANDGLTALQQTYDGGYILGGYSYSGISGDKTGASRGDADYWIVKLDGLGRVQWDKTIGGSSYDGLTGLQQTDDGGYILGGYSYSKISGEKTEKSRGRNDYWVVKLDSAGNIVWDKTIGGTEYDFLTSLQQTADGGYILGGYSNSGISGEKTDSCRHGNDYWLVKLNRDGKIQWDKTVGGRNDDYLLSVKESTRNRYVAGGFSYSGISGDKTDSVRKDSNSFPQSEDYWLVYLNYSKPVSTIVTNPLSEKEKVNNQFSVYPIPAKEIVHIQANAKTLVTLTDAAGKILLTKTIDGSGEIDVSKFSAGVYYLKNNATGEVQKVIVIE